MAETPTTTKRHRDNDGDNDGDDGGDNHRTQIETPKRHRSTYINEQQEITQELLDFLTNLPSDPFLEFNPQTEPDPDNNSTSIDDDDEKERVIRHLLEASDDELGIPSRVDGGDDGGDGGIDGGDGDGDGDVAGGGFGDFPIGVCDGLWELEDEAANYYTLLQSELFMQ